MALRAGYKGFKKLAEGLKLIRPGTLAIDDAALAEVFFPRSEQAVLGAKNLLPNNASNKTDGNVAWVVNADKSITINTSAAASSVQTLQIGEVTGLQGDYILNGVTGGSSGTYGIQLYDVTTSTWITQYAVDGDSTINLADKTHTYRFTAYVRQGVEVSNKTIYPMLRLPTDPNGTYTPFVMTNEQLTERIKFMTDVSTITLNAGSYDLITINIPSGYIPASISPVIDSSSATGHSANAVLHGFYNENDNFVGIIVKNLSADTAYTWAIRTLLILQKIS